MEQDLKTRQKMTVAKIRELADLVEQPLEEGKGVAFVCAFMKEGESHPHKMSNGGRYLETGITLDLLEMINNYS